jgi:hypothetical protein
MKPEKSGRPLAWTAVGSQHNRLERRDYVAVAELLVAAGAEVEPEYLDMAEGPLVAWLDERT